MMLGRNDKCFCGSGKKYKVCHSDIHPDSRFAELVRMYTSFDKLIEQGKLNGKCAGCKENCNVCCSHRFEVTNLEFDYIAYEYSKKYGVEKWKEVTSRGKERWIKFKDKYPEKAEYEEKEMFGFGMDKYDELVDHAINDVVTHEIEPCVFLGEDGKCTIYEFRPFVCRYQGYGYLEDMPLDAEICEVLGDYKDNIEGMIEVSNYFDKHGEFMTLSVQGYDVIERMHSLNYLMYYSSEKLVNPLKSNIIFTESKWTKEEYANFRLEKAVERQNLKKREY